MDLPHLRLVRAGISLVLDMNSPVIKTTKYEVAERFSGLCVRLGINMRRRRDAVTSEEGVDSRKSPASRYHVKSRTASNT